MPASRSPSPASRREPRPPPAAERTNSHWPLVVIGIVALLAVIVATLPASLLAHALPPTIHAEDFSGSLWHGSAGKITVDARDAGALEWRLHPASLFGLAMAADLHWVKVGFALDGSVRIDRRGIVAHDIQGGGPIEDLRDFGVAAGWHGTVGIHLSRLETDYSKILAAAGDIQVTNLQSTQVARGESLGSYDLNFPEDSIAPDGTATAKLTDHGGPVQVQALIRLSLQQRTGTISGTVMARPEASPALRKQLDDLSQLRGRDSQGHIPVEVEFNF